MTGQPPLSPRQRILEAVIACIEKEGIDALTTRKISEQAGTNIASINYYFRSKELLVSEALAMTLDHMLEDIVALIEAGDKPFPETLEEVFAYLIEGGLRFPGIILAHLYGVLVDKRYDAPVVKAMHTVFELLVKHALQAYPAAAEEQVRMALAQVSSSVFFTMLAPGFYRAVAPLDLAQPGAARRLAADMTGLFAKQAEILSA